MSSGKEIIDLTTSDSSSDEAPQASQSSRRPYLPPYRPPTFGARTKEQARKFKHDINAPILKSLANIKPIPTKKQAKKPKPPTKPSYGLMEELPNALTQALTEALKKMPSSSKPTRQPSASFSKRSAHASEPSSSTKAKPRVTGSRPICVGLVAPRVWEMASQSMGQKRTMPPCEDLIDVMSLFAIIQEEKEQKKKQDKKNKGKQPME